MLQEFYRLEVRSSTFKGFFMGFSLKYYLMKIFSNYSKFQFNRESEDNSFVSYKSVICYSGKTNLIYSARKVY